MLNFLELVHLLVSQIKYNNIYILIISIKKEVNSDDSDID